MFKTFLRFNSLLLLFAGSAHAAPDKYDFDKDHTHVIFFVSHEGFSESIGRMDTFDGSFSFDENEPQKSELDVTVKADSIDTGIRELDKVVRSDTFLNVKAFPIIHFKSTHVDVTSRKTGDITGDLTLHGVTRPAVLRVRYNHSGIHPFTNNYVSGFSADLTIKRSDFGMKAYIPDVGDEVRIHIEAEGTDFLKHPGNSKTPH